MAKKKSAVPGLSFSTNKALGVTATKKLLKPLAFLLLQAADGQKQVNYSGCK